VLPAADILAILTDGLTHVNSRMPPSIEGTRDLSCFRPGGESGRSKLIAEAENVDAWLVIQTAKLRSFS
jgi:hypothetical protein